MPDLFDLPPTDPVPAPEPTDHLPLAGYAQRAYLEYALSVVKGRALPDVCDGNKPVQRRILYSMLRMGLAFTGTGGARPVKSARVASASSVTSWAPGPTCWRSGRHARESKRSSLPGSAASR